MPYLVAPVMGTTVSIDVRDAGLEATALEAAVGTLRELESRFTTYSSESEISRIGRGELSIADAHADVREVLDACAVLRAESEGAFDAWRDGGLDPSGYVKGWAAERVADALRSSGATRFALNLGGDVICAGEPAPGVPWRVGIRHPAEPRRMAFVVGIRDGAVATSGSYERGAHVVDARTGRPAADWRSITVLAPDLATADAIATAALAMGVDGPRWAAERPGCEVAAIGPDDRLWTTTGLERSRLS
jgi:thiamine biosynthesis lipoprotein